MPASKNSFCKPKAGGRGQQPHPSSWHTQVSCHRTRSYGWPQHPPHPTLTAGGCLSSELPLGQRLRRGLRSHSYGFPAPHRPEQNVRASLGLCVRERGGGGACREHRAPNGLWQRGVGQRAKGSSASFRTRRPILPCQGRCCRHFLMKRSPPPPASGSCWAGESLQGLLRSILTETFPWLSGAGAGGG